MRRPLALILVLIPVFALGHVSVVSNGGLAIANTTQELVFGVGHGCEGADTSSVRATIPSGVTGVRAMTSDFGKATVTKDSAGIATAVTWDRAPAELLAVDTNYYKLTIRAKLPNAPFTVVYFPTDQTCTQSDGGTLVTPWTNTSGVAPGPNDPEPAPAVALVPAHKPGWNKFTVPVAVDNLALFFADAQIVWKGQQAFSPNATTTELIAGTAGVSALTSIAAGEEIWVKY
jgi:periplasmic copper chaperone A